MEARGSPLQTHGTGKWLQPAGSQTEQWEKWTHHNSWLSVLFNNCPPTPHLRNHSPVRTVTRAFAPAISSPDMSSVTVGKSRTSKPTWFLHFLFIYLFIYLFARIAACHPCFSVWTVTCSGLQVCGWRVLRSLRHNNELEDPHGSSAPAPEEAI